MSENISSNILNSCHHPPIHLVKKKLSAALIPFRGNFSANSTGTSSTMSRLSNVCSSSVSCRKGKFHGKDALFLRKIRLIPELVNRYLLAPPENRKLSFFLYFLWLHIFIFFILMKFPIFSLKKMFIGIFDYFREFLIIERSFKWSK